MLRSARRAISSERVCAASSACSRAVSVGMTLVIWNERIRPARERRWDGQRVMSAPPKRTLPASGINSPLSWAMKVVLPAPFGPMSACTPRAATLRSMASFATTPPKRLVSPLTESRASSATAAKQHDEHEQRSEHHHPVFGYLGQGLFQHHVQQRADQRPDQRALSAQ